MWAGPALSGPLGGGGRVLAASSRFWGPGVAWPVAASLDPCLCLLMASSCVSESSPSKDTSLGIWGPAYSSVTAF